MRGYDYEIPEQSYVLDGSNYHCRTRDRDFGGYTYLVSVAILESVHVSATTMMAVPLCGHRFRVSRGEKIVEDGVRLVEVQKSEST